MVATHNSLTGSTAPKPRGYAVLERKLVLLTWLHKQLGYDCTSSLLEDIRRADEGFNPEDRSHICSRLASQVGKMRVLDRLRPATLRATTSANT